MLIRNKDNYYIIYTTYKKYNKNEIIDTQIIYKINTSCYGVLCKMALQGLLEFILFYNFTKIVYNNCMVIFCKMTFVQ